MRERDVERAFSALNMRMILREIRKLDGKPVGNQQRIKDYTERRDRSNPPLSRKQKRSRRNRDKGRR